MRINNSELIQGIVTSTRLSSSQGVPQELTTQIIPVMEVNPRLLRNCTFARSVNRNTTGAGTVFLTPLNMDFYVTNVILCHNADVVCDGTGCYISAVINSATVYIAQINKLTLTAHNSNISLNLVFPLKIDKNSTIGIGNNAFSVGTCITGVVLFGFFDESSKI